MRIAVVTPIPTPYRDGFWNALSARDDVDLAVFYCAAGKGDRPWSGDWPRKFDSQVLPGRNLLAWRGADASAWDNPAVVSRLAAYGPDAVLIGGYNHLTMLRAMRWCIRTGTPYFLMCESHLQNPRSYLRRRLKDRLVRWVVRNMAGGLPTGKLAAEYLEHYGAAADDLSPLPNVPDVERIAAEAAELRADRGSLRMRLGLSDGGLLLFAGRLIPKKGAHHVIGAMAELPDDVSLAIVGDGPERATLENTAREAGLEPRVRFAGFVEPAEMAEWYAAADLFVLPSRETWGVVVLEALASGMPVVLADSVGCHPDVVADRALGEVVALDGSQLAQAIAGRLNDASAEAFDRARQAFVQRFAYDTQAERLARYLRARALQGAGRPGRAA